MVTGAVILIVGTWLGLIIEIVGATLLLASVAVALAMPFVGVFVGVGVFKRTSKYQSPLHYKYKYIDFINELSNDDVKELDQHMQDL